MHASFQDALQRGDLRAADRISQDWLRAEPESADAHQARGLLLLRRGEHAAAAQLLRQATVLAPDRASAYLALASAEAQLGQRRAARANFQAASALNPNLVAAWVGLGQLALDDGQTEAARQALQRALRLDQGHPQALAGMATLAMRAGRYAEARGYLNRALERSPEDPTLLAALGAALRAEGALDFARQAWERALTIAPGFNALRRDLARLLASQGRHAEAQAEMLALKAHGESPAELAMLRGDLALAAGQPLAAAASFREALRLRPGDAQATLGLARSLLDGGRPAEAESALRAALAAEPAQPALWSALVQVLTTLSPKRAIEACGDWAAACPEDAQARRQQILLLELLGRRDEAEPIAQRQLAAHPDDPAARMLLAEVNLARGDANAALAMLSALDLETLGQAELAAVAGMLGRCHAQMDRRDQAVACWQRARSHRPGRKDPPRLAEPGPEGHRPALAAPALALLCVPPGMPARRLAVWLAGSELEPLLDRLDPQPRLDWMLGKDPAPGELAPDATRGEFLRSRYLRGLRRSGAAGPWLDLLPSFDEARGPLLRAALPDARVALLLRDPRDALLDWLAAGHDAGWWPQDLAAAADWLAVSLQAQLRVLRSAPEQIRAWRYETLLEHPARVREEILGWYGCVPSTTAEFSPGDGALAAGSWPRWNDALAQAFARLEPGAEALDALLPH